MHLFPSPLVRAREALRACLPEPLRDNTFSGLLKVGCYGSFSLKVLTSRSSGRYGHKEMPHHPLEQPERANHALTNPDRKQNLRLYPPPSFNTYLPFLLLHASLPTLHVYRSSVAIDCFPSIPSSSLVALQSALVTCAALSRFLGPEPSLWFGPKGCFGLICFLCLTLLGVKKIGFSYTPYVCIPSWVKVGRGSCWVVGVGGRQGGKE